MSDKNTTLNDVIAGDINNDEPVADALPSMSSKLSKNDNKELSNNEHAQDNTNSTDTTNSTDAKTATIAANVTNATDATNSANAMDYMVEMDDTDDDIDMYASSTEQQVLNTLKAVEEQNSNLIKLQLEYLKKIHLKFNANDNSNGKLDILFQKQLNALNERQQINDNYTRLMEEYVNKKLNRINRHIARLKENVESSEQRFHEFQQHAFTTMCTQRSELTRMRFTLRMAMSNMLTLHLPTYDGTENFLTFRVQFEAIAEHNQWNDSEKAVALTAVLRGRPADIYARLPENERKSFSSIINALRAAALIY